MAKLARRRILITGAASGIGRDIAELFSSEGARLALLDKQAGLPDFGGSAVSFAVDLRDRAAVQHCVMQAVARLGGLDGVVNAAGYHAMATLEDTTDNLWDDIIAVNLTAPMSVIRPAIASLKANPPATVVNIASGSALYPVPTRSAYIASKGGLVAFSKALALELAPGIRVNCICPGAVDTPMLRQGLSDEAYESVKSGYALQRVAAPREIAEAALYLTSEQSSFVTGITLPVDGGRTFY